MTVGNALVLVRGMWEAAKNRDTKRLPEIVSPKAVFFKNNLMDGAVTGLRCL